MIGMRVFGAEEITGALSNTLTVLEDNDATWVRAEAIEEFGLGPFLPLFDRQEDARLLDSLAPFRTP